MSSSAGDNDNNPASNVTEPMRIFVFKSEAKGGLRAFTGDIAGARLPSQFAPWTATGVVRPDKAFPYRIPREQVEKAIADNGFQLWRLKAKATEPG